MDREISARKDAARCLARRPLTSAELRERLLRRGHPESEIGPVLDDFRGEGWLDDLRLAVEYIQLRSERLGHGRLRLERELRRRGVAETLIDRAWRQATEEDGLDPQAILEADVRKRVDRCGGKLGPADFRRVYNALLRGGHDAGSIRAALRPHLEFPEPDEAER